MEKNNGGTIVAYSDRHGNGGGIGVGIGDVFIGVVDVNLVVALMILVFVSERLIGGKQWWYYCCLQR